MRSFILIGFAAAAATMFGQDVTGVGNFSHIVTNLDKSLEFYRDVLGLELAAPARPFDGNPAIMKLGDTPGRSRATCSCAFPDRRSAWRLSSTKTSTVSLRIRAFKILARRI